MTRLFLHLGLLLALSLNAMDRSQIVKCADKGVSHFRITSSLLDAYMSKKMNPSTRKTFLFSDYKNPLIVHSLSIKNINEIMYEISKTLREGFTEEEMVSAYSTFKKLETDPLNLTEEDATHIQVIRMGDFLIGNDLPDHLNVETRAFIMANRANYQAAWGTRDLEIIQEALHNCQLHDTQAPYRSLPQRIEYFAQQLAEK